MVDADDQVVGTTITGRRGRYAVDGLAAGASYRVGARDTIDGDFTDNWHGGDDAASATVLEPTENGTVPDINVTLTGRVAIDADVDVKRKKIRVEVEVIDRTTGLPGEGTVTISTDQFSTRLPLTEGRANITLLTPSEDQDTAERAVRRLRIEYPGHGTPGRPRAPSACADPPSTVAAVDEGEHGFACLGLPNRAADCAASDSPNASMRATRSWLSSAFVSRRPCG